MRLLVTGGRDYKDSERVASELSIFDLRYEARNMTLIHGAASGLDTFADAVAYRFGWQIETYRAAWEIHGRSAGPVRNQLMIDEGKPDKGLVFPGGKGTQDMMLRLFKAGIQFRFVGAF